LVRSVWHRRYPTNPRIISKKLDPRVRNYWFISLVCSIGALLLVFSPIFYMGFMVFGDIIYLGLFATMGLCIFGAAVWSYAAYPHHSYTVGRESLQVRHGLLKKRNECIPYNSIKEMKVSQSAFERLFGIKSIYVHTAGWDNNVRDTIIQGTTNPYSIINKVEIASDMYNYQQAEPEVQDDPWIGPAPINSRNDWGRSVHRPIPAY